MRIAAIISLTPSPSSLCIGHVNADDDDDASTRRRQDDEAPGVDPHLRRSPLDARASLPRPLPEVRPLRTTRPRRRPHALGAHGEPSLRAAAPLALRQLGRRQVERLQAPQAEPQHHLRPPLPQTPPRHQPQLPVPVPRHERQRRPPPRRPPTLVAPLLRRQASAKALYPPLRPRLLTVSFFFRYLGTISISYTVCLSVCSFVLPRLAARVVVKVVSEVRLVHLEFL
mmetsp:Transcript_6879/g.22227  ORF Transcript_6879/g.22227 Transcript_6879/m.22227 type:complete len:227 (-) Transcript_6879:593-1273(-)